MFCMQCGQEIGAGYIKKLIHEELANLDPKIAEQLATQVERRINANQRQQGPYHAGLETKQDKYER
jgi:hypothetical protein